MKGKARKTAEDVLNDGVSGTVKGERHPDGEESPKTNLPLPLPLHPRSFHLFSLSLSRDGRTSRDIPPSLPDDLFSHSLSSVSWSLWPLPCADDGDDDVERGTGEIRPPLVHARLHQHTLYTTALAHLALYSSFLHACSLIPYRYLRTIAFVLPLP